jgi:transcriptional regulator with XRE-family HTH domain
MSQTLGEKLRQAREAKGVSISEVAEQTRISPLYIESIENNNYKPLPGGIFNKGFVKSYAKFVGVDEHEALSDYARLAAENEMAADQPLKVYRPEVLTDDNATSSMAPTLIFAGIILALMTGGVLFLVNYLQNRDTTVANTNTNSNLPSNTVSNMGPVNAVTPPTGDVPTMGTVKVEFRAATDAISLTSNNDGKTVNETVAAGSGVSFEPRQSLRLKYAKALISSARLLINGKSIELPEANANPGRAVIEFEINKDNLERIWNEGRIGSAPTPQPTPATRPSVANTSNSSTSNVNRPPATPRPSVAPPVNRPPANRPPANVPRPTPR